VRYHIADEGGVVGYEELLSFCASHGFDLDVDGPPLPFVYVFGRSRFAVSFFGANLYPENIAVGLEQPDVSDWVTGKFVLEVTEDADANRHLAVAVELAPGEDGGAGRTAAAAAGILSTSRAV
jgi:phenylacetate-CoA ligase